MITIILTLIFKREITNNKIPLIIRFLNRFVLDKISDIKPHSRQVFTLFCGKQGTGKTYSMIEYVSRLMEEGKYKKVISNIPVCLSKDIFIYARNVEDYIYLARECTETVFIIDEIQSFVDSFRTPDEFYYIFCTLRKRNCILLATAQVFDRVAVKLREQVNDIVYCHTYFGCLIRNKCYRDMELNNDKKIKSDNFVSVILSGRTEWGVQCEKIRNLYNTYDF